MLLHIGVNVILYQIDPQFMAPDYKYYAEMTGKQKTTVLSTKQKIQSLSGKFRYLTWTEEVLIAKSLLRKIYP